MDFEPMEGSAGTVDTLYVSKYGTATTALIASFFLDTLNELGILQKFLFIVQV
jgi:hypothetical protein